MSSNGEEKELDKLRKTIEEFRAKAERSGVIFEEDKNSLASQTNANNYNDSGIWYSPPTYPPPSLPPNKSCTNLDVLSPNAATHKRVSSGSICSMNSHASHSSVSSTSSGGSNDSDPKQNKKKRWLPLKTFTKTSRSSQSVAANVYSERDESGSLLSPTSGVRGFLNNSLDPSQDLRSHDEFALILQEKDRKLTDTKLEALTMQHQLHQLQEQITQMQHEMELLRMENDRLQVCCKKFGGRESISPTSSLPTSGGLEFGFSKISKSSLQLNLGQKAFDCCKLHRLVSPASNDDGLQMKFQIFSLSSMSPHTLQKPVNVTIGSLPISRKATWEELDKQTSGVFLEYCRCIDGDSSLGLSPASISFYKVGEQTRVPDTKPPELLPCAFIIGNVDSVEITLKDASCGSIDLMTFRTLIPKSILEQYLKIFLNKKRLILYGPSGTGKSALAHNFANHVTARERLTSNESSIFVYDVKQQGEEELSSQIEAIASRCKEDLDHQDSLPCVILVENCYMLSSFFDTFSPLIKLSCCPFIIGTTLQVKTDSNNYFEWISCSTNSFHVKDYLARFLRRNMIEASVNETLASDEEFENMLRVATWLPFCWHQVNKCLENNKAADVTIGPRAFTSCPIDFYSSCSWFVQVWNYVITPYVIAAIKKIRQSQQGKETEASERKDWVDPTEWVIESFPWNASDMGCDNTLRLKRITKDEIDYPSNHPRSEIAIMKATSKRTTHKLINTTACPSTDANQSNESIPQFSNGVNDEVQEKQAVPRMDLIGAYYETKNTTTVWHRHNSPVTSPSKSSIHSSGRSKII